MTIYKSNKFLLSLFSCLLLSITACSTNSNQENTKTNKVTCTEPRSLICTHDYRPVCAESKSGRYRTYSNGCSACSNPDITRHIDGACPKGS